MKQKLLTFAGITAVALLIVAFSKPSKDATNDIIEANKEFVSAFNSNNAEALSMIYTRNGKIYPSNSDVIEGHGAIKNFWQNVFIAGITNASLTTISVETLDDTAIEEGKYTLFNNDQQQLDQGKYIVIWKKVNGKWKYDKDIWNTSLPPNQ